VVKRINTTWKRTKKEANKRNAENRYFDGVSERVTRRGRVKAQIVKAGGTVLRGQCGSSGRVTRHHSGKW
jgi:hypothetical protein